MDDCFPVNRGKNLMGGKRGEEDYIKTVFPGLEGGKLIKQIMFSFLFAGG